jgi:hypothetical protein
MKLMVPKTAMRATTSVFMVLPRAREFHLH